LSNELLSLQMRFDMQAKRMDAFTTGAQAFAQEEKDLKDRMNKLEAVMAMLTRTNKQPVLSTSEPWKRDGMRH
jgi:hypothetical protein